MLGRLIIAVLVLAGLAAIAGTGFYFALKRPDIPYAALANKYETPDSRYIDLPGGVRMHYNDEGAQGAPTLLLIHGYSASLHTWQPWVSRLGDSYRLVSIDLPGHGLTRAPAGYQVTIDSLAETTHEFARAYGLTRFAIAGSSMGGNVAWRYAAANPAEVEALILVDSAGWPDTRPETAEEPVIFKLLRNPQIAPILIQLDNTRLIRQGLEASFYNKALVDDMMVARYAELSRAPGHREILMQLSLQYRTSGFATPERLAQITAPTLVLTGEADALVPPEHATQFHDAIAGSELIVFEETGHVPQEEAPDASAAAVRAFLDRVQLARAAEAEAAAAQ